MGVQALLGGLALRGGALATGEFVNMAVIDIFRDRERNVPRYNDFREHLTLERYTKFEQLNNDSKVSRIYECLDRVTNVWTNVCDR